MNPTPISSGLLWDYGLEMTDVVKFNGVPTISNTLTLAEWQLLYSSLFTMRYNSNISLSTPESVRASIESYGKQSTAHNIVALHMRYQKFRSDATSRGVTIANNRLTCGNTISPYDTRYAFGATLNHTVLEGNNHTFIFRSALFYNKSGKTVSSIQADFGDGRGLRTIAQNSNVTASYTSEGKKTFKLKIAYTDGTTAESQSPFYVDKVQAVAARYTNTNTRTLNFPVAGFPAPRAYNGSAAGATVTIEYAGTDQVLDRPFIVVEGIDAWRVVSPGDPRRNFDFRDFIFGDGPGGIFVPVNIDYNGQTLNDFLDENGYDLVFIDYNEGTDFIQRNAFMVENVIEWVNQEKARHATRQPNVVLGMSMGGLVARYALRDMENRGVAHNTRLYISHDAPHQGANVPVAAQAAVLHLATTSIGVGVPGLYYSISLASLNEQLKGAAALLETPAARQMLQYQANLSGYNLGFNNSTHTAFMTEYRNLGYPQQTRNVAISNGSECGRAQAFGPYATLLNIDDGFKLNYWLGLVSSIAAPFTSIAPQLFLGAPLTTRTDIKANFVLNALPDRQAQRVYKGKIYIAKKILFFVNVNLTITDKSLNSLSTMLALDSSPGGIYDIANFGGLPETVFGVNLNFNQEQFSFIPTFSSLDIGRGTQPILSTDLARTYSPSAPPAAPKNVPFANFFTNVQINERHVQFTGANGRWLADEVRNRNPRFNCNTYCALNPSIAGSSSACGNTTYTMSGVPTGLPIQWRVSPLLTIVSGQGTTTLTVRTATTSSTGAGWVDALVGTNACGQITTPRKNVQVGGAQVGISGPAAVCPGNEYTYTANVASGVSSTYTWTFPSGWTRVSQGTNTIRLYVPIYNAQYGAVRVTASTSCGTATNGITAYPNSYCGGYLTSGEFVIYPNPADEQLTIEQGGDALNSTEANMSSNQLFGLSSSSASQTQTFKVELLNNQQVVVAKGTSQNKKITLETTSLPPGTYFLQIYREETVLQEQIIVQ